MVLTEGAAAWADEKSLEAASGHPVKTRLRRPDEVKTVPVPAAVVVAPATFNTINQWAAGINDTAALGVLNEALGAGVPIVVAPHTKDELAAHPAFRRNVEVLSTAGVRFTALGALDPVTAEGQYQWQSVLDLLRDHAR
ncbi:hypothetical protein Cs7R123_56860 [Catellatospora sp. TT07R-123]|nr:hypothetical protein Cs7R123_56860 [Catellatospora sp. TT07R-123]